MTAYELGKPSVKAKLEGHLRKKNSGNKRFTKREIKRVDLLFLFRL